MHPDGVGGHAFLDTMREIIIVHDLELDIGEAFLGCCLPSSPFGGRRRVANA